MTAGAGGNGPSGNGPGEQRDIEQRSIEQRPGEQRRSGQRPGSGPLRPNRLLRAEGALVAVGAVGAYVLREASLLLFVGAILLPDASIAAYLLSPRIGAIAYNAVHTYVGPAVVLAAGLYWADPLAVDVGLIWTGHVGVDRLFGFGLKYADREFGDTHLQQV